METVKHFVVSGTNFWNPGDDFVRGGVIRILRRLFPDSLLNFHFYNFNQDFFPQNKFSGISNTVAAGDLEQYREFVDAVVIAGLSAGQEIKDLYRWIINNGLQDRVYLVGAGYENDYVERFISQEPEATIFRSARVITGRTRKTPDFIPKMGLPYHYINCPAILSVEKEKEIPAGKRIERIGFSIQLPHGIGVPNQCCSNPMYELAVKTLVQLSKSYQVEVVAHHKSEYFHFVRLLARYGVNVLYSSFYEELFTIYPRYDVVITTRLHSSLFANGHGIPGIIINDTDRHTHCLEGFPHSVWVNNADTLSAAVESLKEQDLSDLALQAREFKEQLMNRYLEVLRGPFGISGGTGTGTSGPVTTTGAADDLPIHFFTIVLNGEPYIEYHYEVLRQLPFRWHWHVVEGVADLKQDTAWSVARGGRISDALHDNGLSNDGTSQYLERLARTFPENVTLYRKAGGSFWDGKLEMVNAPLQNIRENCLLWQLDVDEIWTAEQIGAARDLFLDNPGKSAAFYYCHFFVGPNLVITSRDTYGNHTSFEWLRTWRFQPGLRWIAHEPPRLCKVDANGTITDVAGIDPLLHVETEAANLVFQHYAYALESQVRFKEDYYGYRNAVVHWRRLQGVERLPALLSEFLPWVEDGSIVDRAEARGIQPIINLPRVGQVGTPPVADGEVKSLLWLRPDSIGDNVLAAAMLPYLREKYPQARITVLCQRHVMELYEASPLVDAVLGYDLRQACEDNAYRDLILKRLQGVQADLALNSLYSRTSLYDLFSIGSNAPVTIALHGDLSNMAPESRDRNNGHYTSILPSPGELKPELERHRDFLKGIGIDAPPLGPVVWITEDDAAFASDFFRRHALAPERTIALFAGAQSELRTYPHYGRALAGICREGGYTVLALGTSVERALNQQNLDDCGAPAINLSGELTLRQTAAILKRCRLAVGAETGTAHIACAVGTPNVVLVGGGHFGRFMPYSPLTSVACLPLACYFCNWACSYRRPHCVKDISPSVIEAAVRQTLEGDTGKVRIFREANSLWRPLPGEPSWEWREELLGEYPYEVIEVEAGASREPDAKMGGTLQVMVKAPSPRLTLVTPSYNYGRYLEACIESVLSQNYPNLEYIIMDGGSSDESVQIIRKYERHLAHWQSRPDGGNYRAIEEGLRRGTGEIMTWLNADDLFHPGAFTTVAEAFGDREVEWLTGRPNSFDEEGRQKVVMSYLPINSRAKFLRGEEVIQQEGTFWRRGLWERSGGYIDGELLLAADLDLWARFFRSARLFP